MDLFILLLLTILIGTGIYLLYLQSLMRQEETIRKDLIRPDRGEDIIFETLARIFIGKRNIGDGKVCVTNRKSFYGEMKSL